MRFAATAEVMRCFKARLVMVEVNLSPKTTVCEISHLQGSKLLRAFGISLPGSAE